MRWFTRPAFRISRLIHRFSQKFWSRHFATMVTCRRTSVTRRPFCLRWFKKLRLCTASPFLTKLSIVVLQKTRLGHAIFRQKIHSYIWVAIPVDWVMVLWCRRTGARVKGRMVTWLPKFHRWIGNQICSAMGLCSRARVELRQKYTAKRQDGRESGLSKAFFYKITLQGIRNSRKNFLHGGSERLACFEMQRSAKVFEEFSGTFCTL